MEHIDKEKESFEIEVVGLKENLVKEEALDKKKSKYITIASFNQKKIILKRRMLKLKWREMCTKRINSFKRNK